MIIWVHNRQKCWNTFSLYIFQKSSTNSDRGFWEMSCQCKSLGWPQRFAGNVAFKLIKLTESYNWVHKHSCMHRVITYPSLHLTTHQGQSLPLTYTNLLAANCYPLQTFWWDIKGWHSSGETIEIQISNNTLSLCMVLRTRRLWF